MAGHAALSLLFCVFAISTAEDGRCKTADSFASGMGTCNVPSERLSVPDQAVLILGNTGSGKSSLARHLTGQDRHLRAVEAVEGEYIIEGDGIAASVCSVTKVPELMTDPATGTHYFDCPGFEDSRGTCMEIASTFYMKDILEHVKDIKILMLTPYHAVQKGKDRREFVTMLMHMARLLKHIDYYSGSLALVVTKVEAYVKQKGVGYVPMPLDTIQRSVATFLQDDVTPFLKEKLVEEQDDQERLAFERGVKLVNMLTRNTSDMYQNIGVFRKPDENGTLDQINLLVSGKEDLNRMIENTLKFRSADPRDFGFAISEKAKLEVTQQIQTLNDIIFKRLTDLSKKISYNFWSLSYDRKDIPATYRNFTTRTKDLKHFARTLAKQIELNTFRSLLKEYSKTYPFFTDASNVVSLIGSFDALQVVRDNQIIDMKTLGRWADPFEAAAEDVAGEASWYDFLVRLYVRLSQQDVQTHKELYNALDGESFLARTSTFGLVGTSHRGRMWAEDLEELLHLTVKTGPTHRCSGESLRVTGDFIALSAVLSIRCARAPRIIEVFALDTVFIDTEVRLVDTALVIVAPTWSVDGHRIVNLDGQDGGVALSRPTDGADGQRGADGVPGLPGGPGGEFLGIGERFLGVSHLTVTARGGRGGDGQSGGHGGVGTSGGGHGGDGGDGGVGGLGGLPGTVRILCLTGGDSGIATIVTSGESGNGGRGGYAGDARPHSIMRRRRRSVMGAAVAVGGLAVAGGALYYALSGKPKSAPPQYHNGKAGRDNYATVGLQQPSQPLRFSVDSVPGQYAVYLGHHLRHPYRSAERNAFYEHLKSKLQEPSFMS